MNFVLVINEVFEIRDFKGTSQWKGLRFLYLLLELHDAILKMKGIIGKFHTIKYYQCKILNNINLTM